MVDAYTGIVLDFKVNTDVFRKLRGFDDLACGIAVMGRNEHHRVVFFQPPYSLYRICL